MLPTIRSRCQLVRFERRSDEEVAAGHRGARRRCRHGAGLRAPGAAGRRPRARAGRRRGAGAARGRRALRPRRAGRARSADTQPWVELLAAVRARGEAAAAELESRPQAELELTARKERKRVETEWTERARRTRRRVQTGALDLALQLVSLWFADLACLAWDAAELVRNCDRPSELREDSERDGGRDPGRLREAIELVEDTRQRFELNVSEELACEALAYRLEQALSA